MNDFDDPDILLRSSGAYLLFNINDLPDRKAILQWYLDLNAGGVVHKKSELDKVRKMLAEE